MYSQILNSQPGYHVGYVCDRSADQAEAAASMFGAKVASLEELAADSDAVIIAAPPASHLSLVEATIAPDRTVLCEKPLMTSSGDARAAVEMAAQAGSRLYVGHFRRTFPNVRLARELANLGLIGRVTSISACEGGRFTWRTTSDYPVKDVTGGVLWDTGSHTLDMALHAAGLDTLQVTDIEVDRVRRDKQEPSHDISADFGFQANGDQVRGHLHVSRKDALPNLIQIDGTTGSIAFVAGLDDAVRLTTPRGSTVLRAGLEHSEQLECFELQVRRILTGEGADDFKADRFIGQIEILEAVANA